MARAIDIQNVIEEIKFSLEIPSYGEHDKGFDHGLEYVLDLIEKAPTLTPPNEPLSIEQLRQMDGEPVWDENGKCYLVDTTYRFCSCSDIEIAIVDKNGDVKRYPQRRALYRRPPEGEENTHE